MEKCSVQPTSTTTRSRYQPHAPHTVCGSLADPQRGQRLRGGASSCQELARRLRVFDFDVFFFGTAIVRFPRPLTTDPCGSRSDRVAGSRFGAPVPQGPHHVIGPRPGSHPAACIGRSTLRVGAHLSSSRPSRAAQRSSRISAPQSHDSWFRSMPHCGQRPAQSGRQSRSSSSCSRAVSRTSGTRSS